MRAFVDALHRLKRRLGRGFAGPEKPGGPQVHVPGPPPPLPMLCWLLELPYMPHAPANPEVFEVGGWIAVDEPVEYIGFADPELDRLLPMTRRDRPEITTLYSLPATGFHASCPYESVRGREILSLFIRTTAHEVEIVVPVYRAPGDMAVLKRRKLDRIRALVRCPQCGSARFTETPEALQCRGCGSAFPRSDSRIDFLSPELRARFNIVGTENVSANRYDGEALNIIHRLRDGLILDCGSGLRDMYYPNVVYYEIVPYESTDVVGVGERLPFGDASFDAVFSFAMLEHVKDPFACARELLRVLKPGGTLYCQVPFLQPVHGYPQHYYNMTMTGLQNLFGDAVRVERGGTFLFGQPVFALSWILNRYVAGLPPDVQETFKGMRVEDLLQPASRYLASPFVTGLAAASREELSCCNCLIGTKVG